jgi:hypothetical protein
MTFIELTHEDGHRIILSMDEIAQIAPLGGDERRGCAITFKRRGAETTSRHIRVKERITALSASLRPLRPRTRTEIRLSWTLPLSERPPGLDNLPAAGTGPSRLHPLAQPRFSTRGHGLDAANRS